MPHPFVILFLGRSGSTALFGNLREHPDVVMRAEMFGNKQLPDGAAQTDENRLAYLAQFWAPFAPASPGRGAKSRGFKFQVDWRNSQFSQPLALVRAMEPYRPKVIVLRRNNALKQAISSLNARRLLDMAQADGTRSAHVKAQDAAVLDNLRRRKLSIDMRQLEVLLDGIARGRAILDEMAAAVPGHKAMTYEDFVADPAAFLAELCAFLEIDPAGLPPQPPYVKITSDRLEDTIENMEELRLFATDTPYEPMLA